MGKPLYEIDLRLHNIYASARHIMAKEKKSKLWIQEQKETLHTHMNNWRKLVFVHFTVSYTIVKLC